MAQGCHLIFSARDREHFDYHRVPSQLDGAAREALLESLGISPEQFERSVVSIGEHGEVVVNHQQVLDHGVERLDFQRFQERLAAMPAEDQQVVATVLQAHPEAQVDLIAGLGNHALTEAMASALPGAVQRVLEHSPSTLGLLEPARAYASAWVANLKTSAPGSADGIAYEVLETAALIGHEVSNGDGKTLTIYNTDRIDFGVKQQASYGPGGDLPVPGGSFHQPARRTVEADLLITRPIDLLHLQYEQIAVDFKHSSTGNACRIEPEQLDGVLVDLQTGEVDQFHFVCNTHFDAATRAAVAATNAQIEAHNRQRGSFRIPAIQLFEECRWTG